MHEVTDAEFVTRIDPYITEADKQVDFSEITEFGAIPDDRPTGEGITIALRDSGIDTSHPLFEDAEIEEVDLTGRGNGDEVGHGTGTAGLIHQIVPDAKLVMVRVLGPSNRSPVRTIERSYHWLLNNADEIDFVNDSWGTTRRIAPVDRLQNMLVEKGIRDVVAAGNSGDRGGSPATASRAWGVGALTIEGQVTRFSSYNPDRDNPDTSQIGKNVILPRAEGTSMGRVLDDYKWPAVVASGTSFAAPIQLGMAASWAGKHDHRIESMRIFEETAKNIPGTPEDGEGRGVLGPALDHVPGPEEDLVDAHVWSLPWGREDFIQVDADVFSDGRYRVDPDALRQAFRPSE